MNEDNSNHQTQQKSILTKITNLLSNEPRDREDLLTVLEHAESRGIIDLDVHTIIQGALQVADRQVREIMIPRAQMAAIRSNANLKSVIKTVIESGHSRFPVLNEENPDEVLGILIAKDLLQLVANDTDKINFKDVVRPASIVPESKRLNMLLKDFKSNRNHMAIVVNEYGDVAGLVTIEDILEQIVGEIEDEHDYEDEYLIKENDNNQYYVKGITPVDEFNEYFGTQLCEDGFDTIGGVVIQKIGHLPQRGETIDTHDLTFKILHSDKRSVRLIEVTKNVSMAPPADKKILSM